MEQIDNTQQQKKNRKWIPALALTLSIVGIVFGFFGLYGTIIGNILPEILWENGMDVPFDPELVRGIMSMIDIAIGLLCLAALILGIVGLVQSIRRETRSVKGIVLSAISMNISSVGFLWMLISLIHSGIFYLIDIFGL